MTDTATTAGIIASGAFGHFFFGWCADEVV
jgi:hypothetical protein